MMFSISAKQKWIGPYQEVIYIAWATAQWIQSLIIRV